MDSTYSAPILFVLSVALVAALVLGLRWVVRHR